MGLEEADLVLRSRDRWVSSTTLDGEVVEEIACSKIGSGLRDELRTLKSVVPNGGRVNRKLQAMGFRGCRILVGGIQ